MAVGYSFWKADYVLVQRTAEEEGRENWCFEESWWGRRDSPSIPYSSLEGQYSAPDMGTWRPG